jgi:hypothetical protein
MTSELCVHPVQLLWRCCWHTARTAQACSCARGGIQHPRSLSGSSAHLGDVGNRSGRDHHGARQVAAAILEARAGDGRPVAPVRRMLSAQEMAVARHLDVHGTPHSSTHALPSMHGARKSVQGQHRVGRGSLCFACPHRAPSVT